MKSAIQVKNLKKNYDGIEVFKDFNLEVEEGKITVIFGPNGSGKSTLFNILSGIATQDSGKYHIENHSPFDFSYIFQNYRETLLPWRTNYENVALPLQIQGKNDDEIKAKISKLQELFELRIDWGKYPYELSGGQQQIVAFIRALTTDPKILFIDEPFSALDYENNLRLRIHLEKYYMRYKPTILLITHNIEEAVHLGHKIVILSKKPTTVLETILNTLVYPRKVETLRTPEFNRVKDHVLIAFQKAASL